MCPASILCPVLKKVDIGCFDLHGYATADIAMLQQNFFFLPGYVIAIITASSCFCFCGG
jgi:hypothetical protein